MVSSANPNSARPTLTLLGKKPLALDAFKARLKIVDKGFNPMSTPTPNSSAKKPPAARPKSSASNARARW
jgi:hypothetical protein